MNQKAIFKIKGMQKDLSAANFNPSYAYEIRNMRITPTEYNDMFSLVNEKSNLRANLSGNYYQYDSKKWVQGTVLGQAIINDSLILFTKKLPEKSDNPENNQKIENPDFIYKLDFNINDNTFDCKELFNGNLDFDNNNPIETLIVYENEQLQKIYWIDGKNECRVINIADEIFNKQPKPIINANYFSFIKEIQCTEKVTIEKSFSSGLFASGVIQYALTYYNKYSAESNIFYISPLFYISEDNRVGDPEENIENSFKITIENPIPEFDYIRVYSIHRTSWNAVPTVKVVTDIKIKKNSSGESEILSYVDTGNQGYIEDPTYLLYVGGEKIIANTITQKDNTLFLGNYKLEKQDLSSIKSIFNGLENIEFKAVKSPIKSGNPSVFYPYESSIKYNSRQIKKFKYLETYRFGIQFQHKSGKWSEAIWINDVMNNIPPSIGKQKISQPLQTFSITSPNEGPLTPPEIGEGDVESVLEDTASTPLPSEGTDYYLPEAFLETEDTTIISTIQELENKGYIAVRPIVVIPKPEEREILAQGIVNPTVFNVEDRLKNQPYAQASWFFRPTCINTGVRDNVNSIVGGTVQSGHLGLIEDSSSPKGEIQCIDKYYSEYDKLYSNDKEDLIVDNDNNIREGRKHLFGVDNSIVTLNSPDLEFGNLTRKYYDVKFRVIGIIPFTHARGDILLQTTNSAKNFSGQSEVAKGYVHTMTSNELENSNWPLHGGKVFSNVVAWNDEPIDYFKRYWGDPGKNESIANNAYKGYVGFPICAFHGKTINGTYGEIKKKVISNIRYASNTIFLKPDKIWDAYKEDDNNSTGIYPAYIFNNEDNVQSLQIKIDNNGNDSIKYYYGNVDKIITNEKEYDIRVAAKQLPDSIIIKDIERVLRLEDTNDIYLNNNYSPDFSENYFELGTASGDDFNNLHNYWTNTDHTVLRNRIFYDKYNLLNIHYYSKIINNTDKYVYKFWKSTSPIEMKYKSSPHFVFGFKPTKKPDNRRRNLLEVDTNITTDVINSTIIYNIYTFYENTKRDNYIYKYKSTGNDALTNYYTLWLGELYRDIPNKFGGNSEQAYEDNEWLVSGDAINLSSIIANGKLELNWQEGDTYFQRYDCLKTIPYTAEDKNQIVEIASFMCESRINIDARYDKMRGQESNVYVTRNNFNLINDVYNQDNNFFVYRGLNTDKINLNSFPNTITWTKTKINGELIDTWTNITLASTLDLDGDKGELRKLDKINNMILAFQDRGISNVMYNENTQLSTMEGVPIEIGNSGKVTGKRYLSNNIGCQNKWTIKTTQNGIYFIDGINKKLYLYDGQFKCLSDQLGFISWANNNLISKSSLCLNYDGFDNFITHYDNETQEILFTNNKESLAYNELLGNFSSFYSYNMPFLTYLNGNSIAISNGYTHFGKFSLSGLYLQRKGNNYSYLFDKYAEPSVEIIVNQNPTIDKIFNTLEFRSDVFGLKDNVYNDYIANKTFDTLDVYNEYQKGSIELKFEKIIASTLKKKFRIWRANIPRDSINNRDRMRNPWLYLKLSMKNENFRNKLVLHDMVVDYFV